MHFSLKLNSTLLHLCCCPCHLLWWSIFVCYFTGIFRYQFLHFICHMNSSEYKENLKRQIEEEKVWGAGKKQGSWPGSCFFVVVCYFTLRICFVIIFVSAFVTGKKKRINGKSESSRKNSEFIAKRGSWKSATANEWGMQSFFLKKKKCLRPVYWTYYTHSTVILVGLLWHSSFNTDQCCPML